ncbi:ABC transporter permease [Hutsoniella sourekii]|uniref:ABC transporter permease n=1 Tax=Hutsoniella sourekii TaxID=87650 RepID=UPI00048048FE|nr:ABC transporter permease [Hutsoniella sourekii]
MFLAFNEIRHDKLRYILVTSLIFLIAYLVFFLTGLAYGLAQENRMAVDKWQADYVLMDEASDQRLTLSRFDASLAEEVQADNQALLAQSQAIASPTDDPQAKESVTIFGVEEGSFLTPNLIEGHAPQQVNDVVVDRSMKDELGYQVGDQIQLSNTDQAVTISGFTDQAKYSVGPVIYMRLTDYQSLIAGPSGSPSANLVNAIVVQGQVQQVPESLSTVPIQDFIQSLPGYAAQNMTFAFMIGFLVLIAAVVVGIFIYVLTMQKQAVFGVMKAQGISSGFISKSVIAQTFILALTGVVLALLATLGSSYLLPVAVPYQNNVAFLLGTSLALIFIAIVAGLFSVRSIVKIDPLSAIS